MSRFPKFKDFFSRKSPAQEPNNSPAQNYNRTTGNSGSVSGARTISGGATTTSRKYNRKETDSILSLIQQFENLHRSTEEKANKSLQTSETTMNIAFLGFIFLIVMVAGLVLVYLQSVIDTNNKISDQQTQFFKDYAAEKDRDSKTSLELTALKKCLSSGAYKKCF